MRRNAILPMLISVLAGIAIAQSGDDPASVYARADVVFTGRLERLTSSPRSLSALFEVDQRIKGQTGTKKYLLVQLLIQRDCHAFEENHSYLIYGQRISDQLWVNPCEGSKLISLAEGDLRYIHSVNPEVSERCNRDHLAKIARNSRVIVTAELVNTEDDIASPALFRPWCGLTFTTEDAYYRVIQVLKGDVNSPNIAVEHTICWDTVTVGGYSPALSPDLFQKGNTLLLFLNPISSRPDKRRPVEFQSVYMDMDENCGAVRADDEVAMSIAEAIRASPENYKHKWLDDDVNCLVGANGETSCVVSKN